MVFLQQHGQADARVDGARIGRGGLGSRRGPFPAGGNPGIDGRSCRSTRRGSNSSRLAPGSSWPRRLGAVGRRRCRTRTRLPPRPDIDAYRMGQRPGQSRWPAENAGFPELLLNIGRHRDRGRAYSVGKPCLDTRGLSPKKCPVQMVENPFACGKDLSSCRGLRNPNKRNGLANRRFWAIASRWSGAPQCCGGRLLI